MMGSSRTNEKGKAPAYANDISPNTHPPRGITFFEGNVDEDDFDSILDLPLLIAGRQDIHRSVAQGVSEPIGNPRVYSMNHNSLQHPQTNPSSNTNTANTNLQEFPLLSDCNMGWSKPNLNQRHNAISSGAISTFGGESRFGSFNRPQVNTNQNNVNFNTNQNGAPGKFEGGFLSLGLGGTSETVSSSQLDSREISDKLKLACARKATSQTFDDCFIGSQSNNSGFSNKTSGVSRMPSTNNEVGSHGSLNNGMGSSSHHISLKKQNDRRLGRADKRKEVPSTELKMVHARKATRQTLDADFMGFHRNNSGFSNQFSNVDRMTSTNYETGVHSTFNSGPGSSSRQSILQKQKNDGRMKRSGDMDHYKGYHSVHTATLGGNSTHSFKSQQNNLKPPEFVKPSLMTSNYTPSEQIRRFRPTTASRPNYAGQVTSQNDMPTQVIGGNLSSQRTATPQVSWVGRGLAGINALLPKWLAVESSVRNSPQSPQGHLSPVGTSLQTPSTGQIRQLSDKGSTRMPHNVHGPIGQSDGALISYPVNQQEPFFTYGQSQNALIQLPKGPQGTPSTNALSVRSQSQKLDFHVRPHHKRTAVAPPSASHCIQHKKRVHPTVHHSMPKSPEPVTTGLIHPSIPSGSRTQPAGPIAAHIRHVRPRVHLASAPAVSHIARKDPDTVSKLSGYKCFLCKKDVALTSEGPVFQPAVPPPVAVLPCGHTFHDQCLQNITLDDQAKDPPCIPCAIGEK